MLTLGMDLAGNIAALHGVEQSGRAVLVKPRVHRDQRAANAIVPGRFLPRLVSRAAAVMVDQDRRQ